MDTFSSASNLSGVARLAFDGRAPRRESVADKHTLICVFLRGAADTLNLWVPYADDTYYKQRPSLAIPLPGRGTSGAVRLTEHYALHPAMRALEGAFKEGRFGAVQSVGTDNTSGSHFECQDQMEHGDPAEGEHAGGGWLGRFLRVRDRMRSPLSAVAIGKVLPESLRGAPSASVIERISDITLRSGTSHNAGLKSALSSLYQADVTLLGEYGLETLSLFETVSDLQSAGFHPENGAAYGRDAFAGGLAEIARLIKARVGLEVACIDLGGWDTHFFQGGATGTQAGLAKVLADGLAAFDLDLLRHRERYTVIVTTEFGRRVYENASLGTDHGLGFTFMALGVRVRGGRVVGQWPFLSSDEAELLDPLGPGGIKPETDYRNVFAEVLFGTHGMTEQERQVVFPGFEAKLLGIMG